MAVNKPNGRRKHVARCLYYSTMTWQSYPPPTCWQGWPCVGWTEQPLIISIDVRDMEGRLPKYHGHEAVEIPGARSMLEALIARSSPWAIVTSGTEPLVTGWLHARDLPTPPPEHLVTAESVENGKPDPACYRLGRERLGLQAEDAQILVLEDSPAGIRAGKAAGCKVLGLVTSHTVEQVVAAEPDWVVRDLSSVNVLRSEDGKVTIEISNALRL